jgi:hypothetical protein
VARSTRQGQRDHASADRELPVPVQVRAVFTCRRAPLAGESRTLARCDRREPQAAGIVASKTKDQTDGHP